MNYFICQASHENNILPEETIKRYKEAFHEAKIMCKEQGKDIYIILEPIGSKSRILNGNSGICRCIMLSASWLVKIASDDSKWKLAFFQTIGHELGHKMNEPRPMYSFSKKAKFTNWVRECRADFYGVDFVKNSYLHLEKCEILESMNLKIENNLRNKKEDFWAFLNSYSHPDWGFRQRLLSENYTFDGKTIAKIAEEVGFRETEYILQIIDKAKLK